MNEDQLKEIQDYMNRPLHKKAKSWLLSQWSLIKSPTPCKLCYWGRLSACGAAGIAIGQLPYPIIYFIALMAAGAATAIVKWSHS